MAGWSDYADFTSLDKLRLTAPVDGILPVIKAINERSVAAGLSTLIETAHLDEISYLTGIQNRVSSLITAFVNHLDNAGSWSGQSAIPNWQETSILAAIGDPARLAAPSSILKLSADWLYQQYKILNLLLWFKDSSPIKIDYTRNGARELLGPWNDPHGTIDTAIANADPNFSNPPPDIIGAWTRYNGYNWNDAGEAWNGKGKLFFDDIPSINKDFDLYLYIGANEAFLGYADYDDGGRGYIQNKLNLLESGSLLGNTTFTSAEYGAPDSEFPKYPPVEKLTSIKGWEIYERNLILKFNVSGGFQYV